MATTLVAVLAGWLTLFTPPPAAQAEVDKDAWVTRLTGLRDHMHTAFGVGPDLTLLDPDDGLEIVREAWPRISEGQVKTGLLKTFAFSKALPEKHAKVLQVLHLGMTDEDPQIQRYAASYVEEYAGRNFGNDPQGYAAWYRANRDKDPNELLGSDRGEARGGVRGQAAPLDRKAAIARAEELTAEGWQLWQQQKFAEADHQFEQAVELDPQSSNAWNGLGWARFNGGDSERAIEAFEKCVELEPRHPAALNGLGQVYFSWREYDKAEKFLKKAAPQAPAAWYGLARLYLLTGKYREAREWVTKIARTQPNDPTVQQMLEAVRNRELPDALRRQIEPPGKPDSPEAASASAAGWQQFNQGKMRLAELNFRSALAKDPEHLPAINGLGFSLLNQGNVGEAKNYFEKYLAVEPDAPGPLNGLARCLKAEGNIEGAIEAWERGYKATPGPTANAAGLATTYLEIGENAKAIPYFEELVKAQPDNEEYQKGLEAARKAASK